ncbi:hypothetical protein HNQ02_003728 [Flavobacterium sp. 7E]|uniref:hypothetical protein n=1 Tax=Flavobacterium sp. 7E TaxID=2735898 RepID=UPI001570D3BB|nr:hypothetical protein [Flavobacterium sp. 7E]NRS90781.1 hypothetical protein [Flavobacterium sp. 7E]
MKNKIIIILLICFISCKADKHQTNIKREVKIIKKENDTVFIDDYAKDTLKKLTYNLKNNYKLILFPAWDENEKVIKLRLINDKTDNTYLLNDWFDNRYRKRYSNIDFQNYFVLHSNGGGTSNTYFWLYDKETGKESLTGIQLDFNLKNELILYLDEDDQYKTYLYDVNSKKKIEIVIPYKKIEKYNCVHYQNLYKTIYLTLS